MTDRWDAARGASGRSIRKQTVHKNVIGDDNNNLIQLPYLKQISLRLEHPVCKGCGYTFECACDTNRKFGGQPLAVGDVLRGIGEKSATNAHGGDTIVVTKLDVAKQDVGSLGFEYAEIVSGSAKSWFRYGYARDYFKTTDFGGCAKHQTLWDKTNPDIPHECKSCKVTVEWSDGTMHDCVCLGRDQMLVYVLSDDCKAHEHIERPDRCGHCDKHNFMIYPGTTSCCYCKANDELVADYAMGMNSVTRGEDLEPDYLKRLLPLPSAETMAAFKGFAPAGDGDLSGKRFKFPIRPTFKTESLPERAFMLCERVSKEEAAHRYGQLTDDQLAMYTDFKSWQERERRRTFNSPPPHAESCMCRDCIE